MRPTKSRSPAPALTRAEAEQLLEEERMITFWFERYIEELDRRLSIEASIALAKAKIAMPESDLREARRGYFG